MAKISYQNAQLSNCSIVQTDRFTRANNFITNSKANSWFNNDNQDHLSTDKKESQDLLNKLSKWHLKYSPFIYGLILGTLVAGLTLGVVTTMWLTSPNNTLSTNASTIASTTIAASTVSLPTQCSSYTVINDSTRLVTATGGSACDTSLFTSTISWIRFVSPGGTQIVTTLPSTNLCGTQATGWYNGSIPASGSTMNGTVCYNWSSNTCSWSNGISVINCSSFNIYGLVEPPVCSLRYCTV